MIVRSYSKINLTLRVLKKLKSGLYNIQSNIFITKLHDEIFIKKIKNDKDNVSFKGYFSKKISNTNNTLVKTLNILRKKKIIKSRYKVVVKKNIPVFAGLGGGTSNAAYLIKQLYSNKPKQNYLELLTKHIGSDLPLFFYNNTYQKSIKKFFNYKKKFKFDLVIVFPKLKCSTRHIYSKIRKSNLPSKVNFTKILRKDKFIEEVKKDVNDLQYIVEKKYPIINRIINFTEEQPGCYFSRITGSGSAIFGVFKSKKTANVALNRIKRKFPSCWCVITRTI